MITDSKEVIPPKKPLGMRSMVNATDVRKLLAKLIRGRLADDGSIDNETLRAVTGACSVLLKAAEQATVDDRLTAIEAALKAHEEARR